MSIHIEGLLVSSVTFSGAIHIVVSDSYARSLCLPRSQPLLLTTLWPLVNGHRGGLQQEHRP
jgi:hypothetical protein